MKVDFTQTLSARAYTLLVCWRFKKIDEEVFGIKSFHKRSLEEIQKMENMRMEMHQKAVMELTRFYGFTEGDAIKILQEECERLVNEEPKELKSDERWCGCCRLVLKNKDWERHQEENKLLHTYLSKELSEINQEQTLLRFQIAKDKKREVKASED